IPARAARPCAPSPPSRNLPAKTTSTPARRCCILYSWAEPPQFVLVLAGTQFNLSEAWLFFAFQPCFTYSANLDSNEMKYTFPGFFTRLAVALMLLSIVTFAGYQRVEAAGPVHSMAAIQSTVIGNIQLTLARNTTLHSLLPAFLFQNCCCVSYPCGAMGTGVQYSWSSRWSADCGLGAICYVTACTGTATLPGLGSTYTCSQMNSAPPLAAGVTITARTQINATIKRFVRVTHTAGIS